MSKNPSNAPRRITVPAPAKVNLYLEVVGKRPDGYHELRTVMQTVDLLDELVLDATSDGTISLECDACGMPPQEENLVYRAAVALQERFGIEEGARIRLEKRIPAGGGLGGGSSDCAAALKGLTRLWGLDAAHEDLHEIASRLGSDIPFFLTGGTAVCRGRGERVEPVPCRHVFHCVLVTPGFPVSTANVYANVTKGLTTPQGKLKKVLGGIRKGDFDALADALHNDLQEPACRASRKLADIRCKLEGLRWVAQGKRLLLCGSGSSFLLIHERPDKARRCAAAISRELSLQCTTVQTWQGLRPHGRPAMMEDG